MFSSILIWLIVAVYGLGYIYVLYCAWTRVPRRDVFDVVPFLHPVDSSMVESLLDPAADYSLRWRLSRRAFREAQLRRMRVYRELVRRMSDNSAVLAEFGRARFGNSDSPAPARFQAGGCTRRGPGLFHVRQREALYLVVASP